MLLKLKPALTVFSLLRSAFKQTMLAHIQHLNLCPEASLMHVWGNTYRTSKKLDIGIKVNLLIEIEPMLGCKFVAYTPPLILSR